MRITALVTCHNRRDHTLACLESLHALDLPEDASLGIVLVDDGSTDGTEEAVRQKFPGVTLLNGDGSLFWCGGMRKAWKRAAEDDPDFYFLINDDTRLERNVITALVNITRGMESRIIAVAAIRDAVTGQKTYGGVRGNRSAPFSGQPESCDTFNANAILIPRAVYRELGAFHDTYTHAMGDFDYGYQATKRGIRIVQSGEWLGTCSHNSWQGSWKDRSLSRRDRFRKLQEPKGLPWKEWVTYNRRNAGWIWPYRCVSPFLRILLGR